MKSLFMLFFVFFFGFFDYFLAFIFMVFGFLFIFLDLGSFYFGGLFFCDSFSFLLVFLSILVFLFCYITSLLDFWVTNFFKGFLVFLSSIFFFLSVCFLVFSVFWFYIFFELIFFLMFIFLLSWGYSPERLQASLYMVFYTIVVSFPFLIFLVLVNSHELFNKLFFFFEFGSYWWFFIFFVFFVKLPVYMVHLWLPKAHVEAPVTGSMVLAGVLLKLGGYGVFRFSFYFLGFLCKNGGYLFSIGLLGGLISCFLCLRQFDLKSFVAYSSICHMGYGLGGFYSFSNFGLLGGVFMLIAHGFCSSCLFYLLYILYERFYSRSLILVKGSLYLFPSVVGWIFIFSIFNMGVPPSFSFFSEIFITAGLLFTDLSCFFFVFLFIFFAGVYGIFFYVIINHGSSPHEGFSFVISIREHLNFFLHLLYLLFMPFFLSFFIII